ncbi:PadR family transcriptional regulator [Bifidobacterium eulemuris]|uniref:PadR family transcriptional regulator n=1 Tax=Bifidobacterium eulemuris TaxID=1765219 RepID=A0A261G3G1_9BIFI|nr:PadR family transcriptional regulator [Bifidobacterium eulemuris]OZG65972.1 PadR family transcriptional regulator [Bifidobacterium eulemuris]QOL32032.1 PadR family transcriptional regulator [Bifidobacterium eulemuris]
MIELMILGFLADGPLCGYELRKKMERLQGYARNISDGTIYPACKRMIAAGLVRERIDVGESGRQRRTMILEQAGRERLTEILREARGVDITSPVNWFVVLAFLRHLPDKGERDAVLRRRYDYLAAGRIGFFEQGEHVLTSREIDDPYRRGVMVSAKATRETELAWLRDMLGLED